jgi:hypothetical protein
MLKTIMAWYVQRFLKKKLNKRERAYSLVLFRYAGENTETLLAGPDTDANLRLIDVFIDQMLNQGHHEILISLIHTTPEGGVVMGLSWRNRTIQRWFMAGMYEMEAAMKEVKHWCEKERKHEER